MKILPYVYKCTHKITGQFYFGFRKANKVPAEQDLGILYFTSSKIVSSSFNEFNFEILAEFFTIDDAYDFEQELIEKYWKNLLSLNFSKRKRNTVAFYNKGGYTLSENTKQKLRKPKSPRKKEHTEKIIKNRKSVVPWNKGLTKEQNQKIKGYPKTKEQNESNSIRQISKNIQNYKITTLEEFTIFLQELYKSGMMMRDICTFLNLNLSTISLHIKLSWEEKKAIKLANNKFRNH